MTNTEYTIKTRIKEATNSIEYVDTFANIVSKQMPIWIPVSERLPEEMGTYLVTLEYNLHVKGVTTLWYHGKSIGWDLCVADADVIAWMPLPAPYMERGTKV